MNRYASIAALLFAGLLSSCGKEAIRDINGPFASSRIKFFNFGPNTPGVNFYANDTKMTAITSSTGTEATTGITYAFAGTNGNGFYTAIAPGQYTLTARIAATVDKDLPISTVTATIADGKYYSFYLSGIYNTAAKSVEGFVVEDPVVAPTDFTVATVRFVNAISNANPMTLYAKNTVTAAEIPVGGEMAYKTAGVFTAMPVGVYDLSTRYAGSSTNAITRTGVSFVGGRVYTVTARGDITVVSTTATNRPILDNTANR